MFSKFITRSREKKLFSQNLSENESKIVTTHKTDDKITKYLLLLYKYHLVEMWMLNKFYKILHKSCT